MKKMNSNIGKVFVGLVMLLSAVVILVGCGNGSTTQGNEKNVIRLGLSPDEDSAAILDKYEPFLNFLEESTGYEIEPFVGADYSAVIQAFKSGHLDVAWFGPSEYVLATDFVSADVEAFVAADQTEGSIEYRTSFVVKNDSEYETIDDLKGQPLAFTDSASTSGHVFGRYSLVQESIEPESFFSDVIYAGSHDAAILSVLNDQVEVAATSSRKIPGFIESGVIAEDDIRIIFESVEIPSDPITYRSDLPEEVKEAFKSALLSDNPALREALKGTGFSGFSEVDDSSYDLVREAFKIAEVEPEL